MSVPRENEREDDVLAYLAGHFGDAPGGQIWVGDDAAVIGSLRRPLISTDLVVEGVHVDRRWCSLADMGWKAVSVNVSDIAAMGGTPRAVVVAIAGATGQEIREIMHGARQAGDIYLCDIVGGDISDGSSLVISVTALGECEHEPVLRSGSCAGDVLYVTGALGASSAGLRILMADTLATGDLVAAHRRPRARVTEGQLLGALGISAMLDCSDGLAKSVALLADAAKVAIDIDVLPCREGVTSEDALFGGEDYELVFTAAPTVGVVGEFVRSGLGPPLAIGTVTNGSPMVRFRGEPLAPKGYEHHL